MRNLKIRTFAICVVLLSWSCTGIEDEPKPVDEATGTYDYTTKLYLLDGVELVDLGPDYEGAGTVVVSSKMSEGFEVKEAGALQFRGSKVSPASIGFTFDIESQVVDLDGTSLTIIGYDGAMLGSEMYNGLYEPASGKLTAYFQFDGAWVDDNGDEMELLLYWNLLVRTIIGDTQTYTH